MARKAPEDERTRKESAMNALSMIWRCAKGQSDFRFVRGTTTITAALRRIVEEGGDHNFVILHADDRKNY